MRSTITKILKDPSQSLFVHDPVSKHWYCREGTDFFSPQAEIENYTKLVVKAVLSMLESCKTKIDVDGNLTYDYDEFLKLVEEGFIGHEPNILDLKNNQRWLPFTTKINPTDL